MNITIIIIIILLVIIGIGIGVFVYLYNRKHFTSPSENYERKKYASDIVPKIIWSYWDKDPPEAVKLSIQSWKTFCPDYTILILNKDTVGNFISSEILEHVAKRSVQMQADYIRIYLLNTFGGIWIDASIIMFQPIDKWLQTEDIDFSGFYIGSLTTNPEYKVIENWFMCCPPNSLFMYHSYKEFLKVIEDPDKYVKNAIKKGVDVQKIDQHYLYMHIAFQVVLQTKNYDKSMSLIKADDTAFKQLIQLDWDSEKFAEYITSQQSSNEHVSNIMKIRGVERKFLTDERIINMSPESLLGKLTRHTNTNPYTNNELFSVYLINLEHRKDRLENFSDNYIFTMLPPFERIDAVKGKDIELSDNKLSEHARKDIEYSEKFNHRTRHYQLTRGGVGCYLSHIKAWKEFMDNSENDVALILEDDIKLKNNLNSMITEVLVNAPIDWDIIVIGCHCWDCSDFNNLYKKINRFILMHCYLINKKAIRKMHDSNNLFPITQQIDSLLSELSYEKVINIYTPNFLSLSQSNSKTDIQIPIKGSKQMDRLKLSGAISSRVYTKPYNNNDLGFFYQTYDMPQTADKMLEKLRIHYPSNPIYIISDGGENFEAVANKYNCQYEYINDNISFGGDKWVAHADKIEETSIYKFLKRMQRAMISMGVNWMMKFEDDVLINGKLTLENIGLLNGISNVKNKFTDKVQTMINKKDCYFNHGGGSIIHVPTFLYLIDHLEEFMPTLQTLSYHDNRILKHDDVTIAILFYLAGYETFDHPEIQNYPDYDKENTKIIHNYKKYYTK